MKKWWELLEDELDAHSETAPDPWSDLDHDVVELTEAQQRFLASFDEQPPIARAVEPPDRPPW